MRLSFLGNFYLSCACDRSLLYFLLYGLSIVGEGGLLKEVSIIGGAKRKSTITVSIIGGFFNGV